MPTYVYRCKVCGTEFEKVQSFNEPAVATCPNGHEETRRVFVPAGIIFKGSGWYITDSRKSNNGGNGKSESSNTSSE